MSRLTIAQRLWLGLGLILGLFAFADLISLWSANRVDATLYTLVKSGEERRGAGDEMRSSLAAIAEAVQRYSNDRDPRQRTSLEKAEKAFEQALSNYETFTSTERSRSLAQETSERYTTLKRQAHDLIGLEDAQAKALISLAAHQHKVESLLGRMPEPAAPSRESPPVQRRVIGKELSTKLRAAARGLGDRIQVPGKGLERELARERTDFKVVFRRYKSLAETRAERSWATAAASWYAETNKQAGAILEADPVRQRALDELMAARRRLDDFLAESIQPAARAELAAAVESASGTAHQANLLITRGLLVALVLGGLAAFATVRAVRAPLRQLVASSRRLAEGDFAHRVGWASRDELGDLAVAFNDMAEKLAATTVSRGYLASIVNSMGEALFVVSHRGIIQTVNPAAERLLGYQQGELTGKVLPSNVDTGIDGTDAGAGGAPVRMTSQLMSKDGVAVPVAISAVSMPTRTDARPAVVCIAQDLRERISAEQRQRQAAVVLENTREGIILTDAKRAILLVNPAFSEITGYGAAEAKGLAVPILWSNREDSVFIGAVWQTVEAQGQWQGEIWVRRKDGEVRPVWKNISVVRDDAGEIANFVVVFSDISAIKAAEQRLNHLAYYDALTDLPNRLLLTEHLRLALERTQRFRTSVALLYVDLDDFKHVNDTLGHEEGDLLLREMACRLPGCVRAKDTVARLGGDEFIVVLEDVDEPQQVARVAEKMLEVISAPFELKGLELRMRASIGISLGPLHGATSEELLKAADAAMYRAKRQGGESYQFFSAELTHEAREHLTLTNALRHPTLHEQLVLHYQPQVALKTGRVVGVEALVRWRHPVRGMLAPGQFVPIADKAGLTHLIGEWVMRTACAQAKAWRDEGTAPLRVAVNVSPHEIRSHSIVDRVEWILSDTGLDPSFLELEITEGALQVGDEVVQVLEELRRLGVRLALDDFGTGYSSLGSIKSLPFGRIKIDRAFVRDLQHDGNDRSIARAIIAMGRSLKVEILAEGIETYAQLRFLRDEGCDEVQGYLLGHPMTAEELDIQFPERIATLSGPELQLVPRDGRVGR